MFRGKKHGRVLCFVVKIKQYLLFRRKGVEFYCSLVKFRTFYQSNNGENNLEIVKVIITEGSYRVTRQ